MISTAPPQPTQLPYQARDFHVHVFDNIHPKRTNETLLPPTASSEQYAEVQRALGFSRHVLVQPSAHCTDDFFFLDTLRLQPSITRDIAVVDASISDSSLSSLENSGIVGVCFNQAQDGATSMDMFDTLAFKAKELGSHIKLYLTPAQLLAQEHCPTKSPVPFFLDRVQVFPPSPIWPPRASNHSNDCYRQVTLGGSSRPHTLRAPLQKMWIRSTQKAESQLDCPSL